ncbi:MAG: adenylate/guanylate cyclase domain-containing protein [Lamprobacter sp.]|uniref:adenylate/guanylate cyclase domain-containing protein n=1 Tax=Lamprobacter sp. TaxID=3100796 RepID=UPI002B261D05|nr:adenylate/guanylate cyclase domain-containing protein [Lamprobacter sp.]MEA3640292.1 adenylate/guanylate cyclase domain-containing protein [Lamprobacter sp.]
MQGRNRSQLFIGFEQLLRALEADGLLSLAQPERPEAMRELLEKRLNPLLDAFLLESQPQVEAYATVLIADIRGFTALMSSLPMATMLEVLNRWFASMTEIIQRFDGAVDKFIGDAVMALFGLPQARADDAVRALACAAEMQRAMLMLNQDSRERGLPEIFAGIAVNTGSLVAGSFGATAHSEYTVIGDVVNLASRMESFALRGQVLMSEATRAAAGDLIEVGNVNVVRFKGIRHPVQLYELLGVDAPEHRLVVPPIEVRRSPRIRVSLDAIFRQVDGHFIHPEPIPGLINDIGYFGLRADLPFGLPDASDVLISLSPQQGLPDVGDLYARVVQTAPWAGRFRTSLELSASDASSLQRLKDLIDESLWRH